MKILTILKKRKNTYKKPERGGAVTYYEKDTYYHESDTVHVIIQGGTDTGKTKRVMVPSIYTMIQNGDCFITNDTKKELYYTFKKYLIKKGYDVILIDYRNPDYGLRHLNYYVKTGQFDEAQMEAEDLATTLVPITEHQDPMWNNGAKSLISATMLAIALNKNIPESSKNIVNVFYNMTELGRPRPKQASLIDVYFQSNERTDIEKIAYGAYSMSDSKVRMSFNTIATSALRDFTQQKVARQSSVSDFDLRDYAKEGAKPVAVFVVNPEEKPAMERLYTTFLEQCNRKLVEEANKIPGNMLPRRWFFVNDEFTNMGKIPYYDRRLTVNRGRNIIYIHGIQNYSQMNAVYGRDIAETIAKNCRLKIWLEGSDNEDVEALQKSSGYTAVVGSSTSRKSRGLFSMDVNQDSYNYSSKKVPLLKNTFLTEMKAPDAVVKKAGMYAFKTTLPFWQDTKLRETLEMSDIRDEVPRAKESSKKYLALLTQGFKQTEAVDQTFTDEELEVYDEEHEYFEEDGLDGVEKNEYIPEVDIFEEMGE